MLKVKSTGSLYYGKVDDLPIGPIILNTATLMKPYSESQQKNKILKHSTVVSFDVVYGSLMMFHSRKQSIKT